jgi:hypothetical protein
MDENTKLTLNSKFIKFRVSLHFAIKNGNLEHLAWTENIKTLNLIQGEIQAFNYCFILKNMGYINSS